MRKLKTNDHEIAQHHPHLSHVSRSELPDDKLDVIDVSLAEMETGKITRQDDALKKYKKWLTKL